MVSDVVYFVLILLLGLLGSAASQTCTPGCSPTQFCGNTSTFNPVCVDCNVACYNCTNSQLENCITCSSNYYMFNTLCRECDVSCNGCNGPGPESCKQCAIAYHLVGDNCKACPTDTFGMNCVGKCHCLNGPDDCDKVTGKCESWQCAWGWQNPPECQIACQSDRFGINCGEKCNCPVNDTCSPINGYCDSGKCHPEYGGPACQIRLAKLVKPPSIKNNVCGNITVTWNGWVKDTDIGEGPIALYLLLQEVFNSTEGWVLIRNISHQDAVTQYKIHLTNLDRTTAYRFRVDVRAQDGSKLLQEYSPGFTTEYYTTECIIPTTTTTESMLSTTTPFKPPDGSLFTTYKLSETAGSIVVQWSIDSDYANVVDKLTLSYVIIGYGDCKVVSNSPYTSIELSNETVYTLTNLNPWTRYKIRMEITTTQQNISNDHKRVEAEITTPETVPIGTVQNITEIANTSNSLTISWSEPVCQERGGFFVRYDILVSSLSLNVSSDVTFRELFGLQIYTEYDVQIAYINTEGAGPLSSVRTFRTGEGVPASPTQISLIPNIRSISVTFKLPVPANGIIRGYDVAYSMNINFQDGLQKSATTNAATLLALEPAKVYYVKVRARTGAGYGDYSPVATTTTKEDVPGPPASLAFNFRNESCLGMTWTEPLVTNGVISAYHVIQRDTTESSPERNFSTTGTARSEVMCDLLPGRRYHIELSARTSKGYGGPVHLFVYTEQSTPNIPSAPKKVNSTATTIMITIDPVFLTTGPLTAYLIYVNDITSTSGKRKRDVGNPPGYITAKLLSSDIATTYYLLVGDGKTYNGYQNKPLTSGHRYEIYLEVESTLLGVTKTNYNKMIEPPAPSTAAPVTVTIESNNYTGVIIAIIIIIVLIIIAIIVVCILYWYRRNRSYTPYTTQFDDKATTDVYSHVDDYDPQKYWNTIYSHRESRYIIAGRNLLPNDGTNLDLNGVIQAKQTPPITFQQEFHDLPHGQLASWNDALKSRNQRKNRFPHLLPYDHSRIVLRPDENSTDDYINANYVHGYHKQNAYIAAQSPFNEDTVLDFWRMIYQMNVSVIVMITNIVEDNIVKCTKYWPEQSQGKVTYGNFFLELIDTLEFASYTIRTLKFRTNVSGTRVIHIFDFCSWPDHGVLDDPIPLLEMRFKVREYHSDTPTSPLLVHCGTGVGRTGAYIAIDSLLEQYDREGRISVSAFVRRIRKDRIQLVRTAKQYVFIYDSIFEARHAGKTRAGLDLKDKYHQLTRKNPKTKHSYLRDQFDCLCRYTRKLHTANCSDALSHSNMEKNRFPDVIPTNAYRAVLHTPGGVGRTDYVNAVLLDSHRKRDHFIVTQTPLHVTVIDFWKLIYDYNVHTIVMMENYKHEDDTCAEYWPEEKKMKQFEPFFIDSIAVYQQDNITIRHFKIHSMLNPRVQAREVRQFQFNAWNDADFVPRSKSMLLDLMDLVKDWQNVSCEDECPIVVHCKDGATHSGLFVAVSNICDAMQDDGDVDVFHAVKRVKKRRTQIVDLVEQYRFCYKVLWDYMNMRLPGGTLTNMMDHTLADKLYNVGSLSLPSYTSHLEYSQFDYAA